MHAILEMLPLIALGLGYVSGKFLRPEEAIYFLAYGAIVGTVIQFIAYRALKLKMQKMTLITGLVLMVFSLITIVLRNPTFVYLKPTAVMWLFAAAFLLYPLWSKKTIIENMLGEHFSLPAPAWNHLNWAWIAFNFLAGLVNLWVVLQVKDGALAESAWVQLKVFWLPIATFVFVALQSVYLFKVGQVLEK